DETCRPMVPASMFRGQAGKVLGPPDGRSYAGQACPARTPSELGPFAAQRPPQGNLWPRARKAAEQADPVTVTLRPTILLNVPCRIVPYGFWPRASAPTPALGRLIRGHQGAGAPLISLAHSA